MLEHILVPLDSSKLSEQILPFIGHIVKSVHSRITLLHVVDTEAMPRIPENTHQELAEKLLKSERDLAHRYLRTILDRIGGDAEAVSCEVIPGSPAEAIVSYAHSQGIGLIAMTTHGRSGLNRWFMGSVADKVLHAATVPLLLFRPQNVTAPPAPQIQTVLLPLDGSPLAESAMPMAEFLARALALKVLVARAVPTYAFPFSDPYTFGDPVYSAELMEFATKDAADYLDKTVNCLRLKGLKAERCLLLQGDTAGQIIDLAGRTTNVLVVMTTHGRSGLGRWVLGSVADRVVRGSGCPVLLVRSWAAPSE